MELAMCFMLGLGGYGYVGAMWNSLYVHAYWELEGEYTNFEMVFSMESTSWSVGTAGP